VAAVSSFVSGVAERYAGALFEAAREEQALDAVEAALDSFAALLAESADLRQLVSSPLYSTEEQTRALEAVLARAGIDGFGANFILLTARNRRLFVLPEMIRAFKARLAEHRGEVAASVVSAAPLSEAEFAELKAALTKPGRHIRLAATVDPSLIGGLVVQVGSRSVDTSLKTKLNALKVALKEVR
jgi:F-type H+-transporting ATPase subunit delta